MSPAPREPAVGGQLPWLTVPRGTPPRRAAQPRATVTELRRLVPCLGCDRTPGADGRTDHAAGCHVAAEEVARGRRQT